MLPKIKSPIFDLVLPSNNKKIKFRPFTVKEEKVLLIAKESNERKDVLNAFKQIINNCIIDDIDVDKLPVFDLEYAFLMIRAKSSNNISEINIIDEEDGNEYTAFVDLDAVMIEKSPEHNTVIDLDGVVGVVMRYPTIDDIDALGAFDGAEVKAENMIDFIRACILEVYDENNSYKMSAASEEEKTEFFESLNNSYFEKIQKFFSTFPVVKAEAVYKNKAGEQKTLEIKGANNFL